VLLTDANNFAKTTKRRPGTAKAEPRNALHDSKDNLTDAISFQSGIALCPVAPAQGITGVISPGNVASNTAHVQNIC
jgi:hypothetical protein